MGADEWAHWVAFNNLSPIGDERGDVQAAMVVSTLANINRRKGQQAYKIQDFLPYSQKESGDSEAQLLANFQRFVKK